MLGDGIFIHVKGLKTNKYFISIFPVHSSCHFLITVQYHFYFLFFSSYLLELQTFHSKYITMLRGGKKKEAVLADKSQDMSCRFHFLIAKRQWMTLFICLLSRIRIKALLIVTYLHEVRKQGQFPSGREWLGQGCFCPPYFTLRQKVNFVMFI